MYSAGFITQVDVYFRKTIRIAQKEHFWKSIIFAAIIAFAVAAVVGDDMFSTYESTKSGFFAITSACIWVGIFNTIQNICKEHEIIRADYRGGMKISAYIAGNTLWQLILSLFEAIVIFAISWIFVCFNTDGVIFQSALLEYFLTMFLLVFSSSLLGIMVSSLSTTPTTAMTIMPFVLILQLIMSGVLFTLSGFSEKVSNITFSKWGMSAFGCIADLNNPKYVLSLSEIYPEIERMDIEECYDHAASTLFTAWIWCIGIAVICVAFSIVNLKFRNRHS